MAESPDLLSLADGVVDLLDRTVRRQGANGRLTGTEATLLRYLAERSDRAVPRDEVLAAVWGYKEGATTRVVDLAVFRLRRKIEIDPSKPVHVLSERHVGYRFVPGARRHAAPVASPALPQVGPLLGRDALLSELQGRGGAVSLVGAPGIGKSHLAAAHAARGERAWWVDLHGCTRAIDAVGALAEVARVPIAAAWDPAAQIGFALGATGPAVLVLDSVDHLAGQVHGLVRDLVARAPALQVVTTSRAQLHASLPMMRVGPMQPAAAAELFRALATDPEGPVERLVEVLQHTPLAIRLAARRSTVVSVQELVEQLDGRIDLLAGRSGLEEVIGWTWDLLDPELRRALARLAVLRAPFPLSTAAVLLERSEADTAELLLALCEQSLVEAFRSPRRFRLVAVVAAAASLANPEESAAGEARTIDAIRQDGARLLMESEGDQLAEGVALLVPRIRDVLAATERARHVGSTHRAALLLLAAALQRHSLSVSAQAALLNQAVACAHDPFLAARARLWRAYLMRSADPEGAAADLGWLGEHAPGSLSSSVWRTTSLVALAQGDLERAQQAAERALEAAGPNRSPSLAGRARRALALVVSRRLGPSAGLPHALAYLELAEAADDDSMRCSAHQLLGHLEARLGHYPVARSHFEAARDLALQCDLLAPLASSTFNLGNVALRLELLEEAAGWYGRAQAAYLRLGPRSESGEAGMQRASTLLLLGRQAEAHEVLRTVEQAAWFGRFPRARALAWMVKGRLAYAAGDPGSAARLFGVAVTLLAPDGVAPMTANVRLGVASALADAGQPDEAEAELAVADRELNGNRDPSLACLRRASAAHVALARGQHDAAEEALAGFDALLAGEALPEVSGRLGPQAHSGFVSVRRYAVGGPLLRERRGWLLKAAQNRHQHSEN